METDLKKENLELRMSLYQAKHQVLAYQMKELEDLFDKTQKELAIHTIPKVENETNE